MYGQVLGPLEQPLPFNRGIIDYHPWAIPYRWRSTTVFLHYLNLANHIQPCIYLIFLSAMSTLSILAAKVRDQQQDKYIIPEMINERQFKNMVRRTLQAMFGHDNEPVIRNWYQFYFDRYKKARDTLRPPGLGGLKCPSVPGLVSIVLPVYNGEAHLAEAIDSILAQTYRNIELIIIDDGSSDSSPEIIDKYAGADSRIKVIHQENRKLPRSLSRGFRLARGEYLTWTSDDNRLKPECMELLVDCLRRHPSWDMVYANMDIIDEDGMPLRDSEWYCNYQVPAGSEHVHLPADTAELNTWPNQYIGAAFLYRDRVGALLRDYSRWRFTIEDYDYFMQINEFFRIKHSDFPDTVYEYRLHGRSLTSREKELQILEQREFLMVFDDFRRDFNLTPVLWMIEGTDVAGRRLATDMEQQILDAGDLAMSPGTLQGEGLPRLWFPCCYVHVAERYSEDLVPPPATIPANSAKILVIATGKLPGQVNGDWDMCITLDKDMDLVTCGKPWQGWYSARDCRTVAAAAEILCRKLQFQALEDEIFSRKQSDIPYSVVICTYRRTHILEKALRCAARQDFDQDKYEVIVVNNDPGSQSGAEVEGLVKKVRRKEFQGREDRLRLVVCPFKGLSHARNAGISEARGEVICFLDDDSAPEKDWLSFIHEAYSQEPGAGVVGGRIQVEVPEPRPEWLEDQALPYWSHFDPGFDSLTWTENWWEFPWGANWTARRQALLEIGGFRCRYGRKGNDFGGGEELLAACLVHRLGYKIGIAPAALVRHMVDKNRFTKKHVCKTIRSALLVNYRLQTDLYMPRWLGARAAAKKTGSWLGGIAGYLKLTPFKKLELRCNIAAHIALLKLMAQDYRNRLKLGNGKPGEKND